MRPLKFRAWIDTYFYYFSLFELANMCEPLYFKSNGYDIALDQYPVQQFTGLLDKNGKEIYEGDILRTNWTEYPDTVCQGTVIFKYCGYRIEWNDNHFMVLNISPDPQWEIIGNIHENPELVDHPIKL